MFFGVRNFENTSGMKVSVVWKFSKFNLAFQKQKQIDQMFFVLEVIAPELTILNCLYEEGNICHWQSIC